MFQNVAYRLIVQKTGAVRQLSRKAKGVHSLLCRLLTLSSMVEHSQQKPFYNSWHGHHAMYCLFSTKNIYSYVLSNRVIYVGQVNKDFRLFKQIPRLRIVLGMDFLIYGRNCCQFFQLICPHEAGIRDRNYTPGVDFLDHDFL